MDSDVDRKAPHPHPDVDPDLDLHPDVDPDLDLHPDLHPDPYPDVDSDAHPDPYPYVDPDAHRHPDAHADSTPTSTPTQTPTRTPTRTPSVSPTRTRTQTQTSTPTPTATGTPPIVEGVCKCGAKWLPSPAVGVARATGRALQAPAAGAPLRFEANAGQADPAVKFLSGGPGYRLFLTNTEAVLDLASAASDTRGVALRMTLAGHANPAPDARGLDPFPSVSNDYLGNDPGGWHTNVRRVRRRRLQGCVP